jgi:hypothetical protein
MHWPDCRHIRNFDKVLCKLSASGPQANGRSNDRSVVSGAHHFVIGAKATRGPDQANAEGCQSL